MNPVTPSPFQPRPLPQAFSTAMVPGSFSSLFDSLMARAGSSNPSGAQLAVVQSRWQRQQTLFGMMAPAKSQTRGLGNWAFRELTAMDGPFGLPSWAYDVQRVMGNGHTQQLLSLSRQAASLLGNRGLSGPSLPF